MKLLLAEDDRNLARGVEVLLQHSGYLVDTVYDGQAAYDYARHSTYDCIIMDVMMPLMDGLQVVKRLRSENVTTAILLLTAKGDVQDRIAGLDAGADDYLPKPFEGGELLARIRALMRRSAEFTSSELSFEDLSLNPHTFRLSCGNKEVSLGSKAYQVMEIFLRNPHVVISAAQFMERVWGWDSEAEIHVVWVNVSFLRKQLIALGSRAYIKTLRGIGYSLEGPL